MLPLRTPTCFTTWLVVALMAMATGCRALDVDKERDKDKNAGGGSMYRDAGGARSW